MISQILSCLEKELKPGFAIQVDIHAWHNDINILKILQFKESLVKHRGTSMHICLTKNIELTDRKFKQCGYDE